MVSVKNCKEFKGHDNLHSNMNSVDEKGIYNIAYNKSQEIKEMEHLIYIIKCEDDFPIERW